jgi:shikimate 5-dehydrogenase
LHCFFDVLLQEAACALCTPDDVAAKIGAVNTLVRQPDGSMIGHNTDWDAAITAVQEALAGMPRVSLVPAPNA